LFVTLCQLWKRLNHERNTLELSLNHDFTTRRFYPLIYYEITLSAK